MTPLEGPNAGWINNALESAIEKYGAPKHIISDQASVFTGDVFAELLDSWNIKPRLGAVMVCKSNIDTELVPLGTVGEGQPFCIDK